MFLMARTDNEDIKKTISNYITYADTMKPAMSGANLKQMGIKEGPVFGEILDALKKAKIDRNLQTKEEEMEFVRDYIKRAGIRK